jgi:hypothetical protein
MGQETEKPFGNQVPWWSVECEALLGGELVRQIFNPLPGVPQLLTLIRLVNQNIDSR